MLPGVLEKFPGPDVFPEKKYPAGFSPGGAEPGRHPFLLRLFPLSSHFPQFQERGGGLKKNKTIPGFPSQEIGKIRFGIE